MDNNVLDIKDYELLDLLDNITSQIASIYSDLISLEIAGKREEKFELRLKELQEIIKREEKLYKSITPEKSTQLINHILEHRVADTFTDDMESIVTQNYEDWILRRVIYNLRKISIYDLDDFKENNTLYDYFCKMGLNDTVEDIELKKRFASMISEKVICNNFLLLLNDALNLSSTSSKQNLIGSKYYTSFIVPDIERDLLKSNMQPVRLTDTVEFKNDTVSKNFNLGFYKIVESAIIDDTISKQIGRTLQIHDEEYSNEMIDISMTLRVIMLRASLLLSDDENIYEFNEAFHETIEDERYTDNYSDDHISIERITSAFKSIKNDRFKVKSKKK